MPKLPSQSSGGADGLHAYDLLTEIGTCHCHPRNGTATSDGSQASGKGMTVSAALRMPRHLRSL